MLKSKHKRSYPDLARGDEVRLRVKKYKLDKETKPGWSDEVYKVDTIHMDFGRTTYGLKDSEGNFVPGKLMRHELLKVG